MKALLMIIGTISLGLGTIGLVLPVLPTTPFLLISLACYMKSSRKLHDFILTNKYLSPYVKDYISGNGIPMAAKKKALFLIWVTIGFSVLFIIDRTFVKIMLLTIATIVSTYIWTRNTPQVENPIQDQEY